MLCEIPFIAFSALLELDFSGYCRRAGWVGVKSGRVARYRASRPALGQSCGVRFQEILVRGLVAGNVQSTGRA